jgi:cytidylate kinase
MSVITIDGYAWSGRNKIASLLTKAQKSTLIDKDYLSLIVKRQGIDPKLFLQRVEMSYPLTRRFTDFFSQHMHLTALTNYVHDHNLDTLLHRELVNDQNSTKSSQTTLDSKILNPKNMQSLLESVTWECISSDNSVIVGCGSQTTLADDPSTIKVFLTAPKEIRIARAKMELKVSDVIAAKEIEKLDANRARFHKHVFNNSWDDRSNYDLYLDSGTLDYGNITQSILTANLKTELYDLQVLAANLN